MKIARVFLFLVSMVICAVPVGAKDILATGYTSASGIFAGLWVAQEGKFFEKYGIQSNLVLIPSASRMAQAILGGDVPFGGGGGNAAVDATLAGGDFVMVGALAKVPAFYIMAPPEIKSMEELRGKVVGITRFGSSTDFAMRYILRKYGLEVGRDVTLLQTGDNTALATALHNRHVMAGALSSPANLRVKDIGAKVLVDMGKAGVYFPHDAFMARRSFINTNQDLVRRFLMAYSEGVHALYTNPDLGRRAIQRYTRANDIEVLHAVHQYALDYVEKIPYNTREGILEVLNQAAARNPKAKAARPEDFYDDRFVRELETSGFYKTLWGKNLGSTS
jgi:NitT/TauT family transport system substrate-binding protein